MVEPLNEIQAPLKEAVAPLTDLKNDIDNRGHLDHFFFSCSASPSRGVI